MDGATTFETSSPRVINQRIAALAYEMWKTGKKKRFEVARS
jgi:hypothetical protein